MKRRTKLILWIAGGIFLLVLVVFVVTFPGAIFIDAFIMYPIRARTTRVAIPDPLSNGGLVTFYRNNNGQWQSDGYDWNATYTPPGGAAEEKLPSWTSNAYEMKAYSSGPLVIIMERSEFVEIRTAAGKWTYIMVQFPGPHEEFRNAESFATSMHMDVEEMKRIQAELEPPVRTTTPGASILNYAPDTREFVMSYGTVGGGGRVLLQLSEDGEKLKLIKTVKGMFRSNGPTDSLTPDPDLNPVPSGPPSGKK
jgi:hypothetical protein